jgi:hypothetical protein
LWDIDRDPDDPAAPYTPYSFLPAGKTGVPGLSMGRDWARRESVLVVPSADGVIDGNGRVPGAMERRDFPVAFRVIVGPSGDLDAAYDLLAAQVAPGVPQRLVYQTDSGALWFTVGHNPSIRHTLSADNKGLTAFADFTVTWRIRPDWRARYSEASQRFRRGTVFVRGTTFGSLGSTTIAAASQTFTVDATGTAGFDLPTLPDSGATITISGPAGGLGGMIVQNASDPLTDGVGNPTPTYFTLPFRLNTASDSCTLNLASQTFTVNGQSFRPTKPDWQPWWFRIRPGMVNQCAVVAQGASPLTGGRIKIDWIRRRA